MCIGGRSPSPPAPDPEVEMERESEKAKEWLPPYQFRAHLIDRVRRSELSLNTANLYISHVRQFYEWAWQTNRIKKLPFT